MFSENDVPTVSIPGLMFNGQHCNVTSGPGNLMTSVNLNGVHAVSHRNGSSSSHHQHQHQQQLGFSPLNQLLNPLQGHAILGSGSSSGTTTTTVVTTGLLPVPTNPVNASNAPAVNGMSQSQNNNNNNSNGFTNSMEQAIVYAAEANRKANVEKDYYKAILLYGEAIKLHNQDCRFYLNRSYCYAQLELYQLALDDAEDAIRLDDKSGKCYYRKGQALIGLKKFLEAERAFTEVLKLEPNCQETKKQLLDVRLLSLQSLRFDEEKSKAAALQYNSIEEAITALLALRIDPSFTGDDHGMTVAHQQQQQQQQSQQQQQRNQSLESGVLSSSWGSSVVNQSSAWDDAHKSKQQQHQQQQLSPSSQSVSKQQINSWGEQSNLLTPGMGISESNAVPPSAVATASAGSGVIGLNGFGQRSADHMIQQQQQHFNNSGTNGVKSVSETGNGYSPHVAFYQQQQQQQQQRPNSSSPLDRHHQQLVIGNNALNNSNNSMANNVTAAAAAPAGHNMAASVFDGSCIGKANGFPATYYPVNPAAVGSSSSGSNANGNNVVVGSIKGSSGLVIAPPGPNGTGPATTLTTDYPKNKNTNNNNNTANNFNGILNTSASSSNPSSSLISTTFNNHSSPASASSSLSFASSASSAVIGSGRHLSGGVTSAFKSEQSVSPVVSNHSNESSSCSSDSNHSPGLTISDVTNQQQQQHNNHYNPHHHQVIVSPPAFKQQQQPTPQGMNNVAVGSAVSSIANRMINGSGVAVNSTPANSASTSSGSHVTNNMTSGSVWGSNGCNSSSSNNNSNSNGGTFADIVKKKSTAASGGAPALANNSHAVSTNNKKGSDNLNGNSGTSSFDSDCDANGQSVISRSSASNGQASLMSKKPTNIWGYNGLRVANVSPTCPKSTLQSMFSKFGKLKQIEKISNKNVENQFWIFYDNPSSPVEVIAKYQGCIIPDVSLNKNTPLKFYFAATDDQKDLKFSRPKQPPDSRGECYYWRTTNCFSRESCSLLHIPSCKNIDAQVWMKMNREPNTPSSTSAN